MSITLPTNIPKGDRRTFRVALPAAPVALLLVDRDGDMWREAGTTDSGETLLVCDAPQDPADQGEGESFPWTPRLVEAAFGPLHRVDGAA